MNSVSAYDSHFKLNTTASVLNIVLGVVLGIIPYLLLIGMAFQVHDEYTKAFFSVFILPVMIVCPALFVALPIAGGGIVTLLLTRTARADQQYAVSDLPPKGVKARVIISYTINGCMFAYSVGLIILYVTLIPMMIFN